MEWHPIAAALPMLEGDAFDSLVADIKANGLRQPIVLFEGKVLDGRNRDAACGRAGVTPTYTEFDGDRQAAVAFVRSMNFERRHWTSAQKAMADAKLVKLSEAYAAEVGRMKAEAAERKSEGGKAAGKGRPQVPEKVPEPNAAGEVREHRAKASGTNANYISLADRIEAERPDLGDKVLKGEMSIKAAGRELKRDSAEADTPLQPTNVRTPIGVIKANEAVNCLKAIPKNDALRKRGFQIVTDWIKHNSKES